MRFIILGLLLLIQAPATLHATGDWGRNGHRTTALIAKKHLNRKTLKQIGVLLEGQSLEVVSTWADEIKSDGAFRKYSPWHYVNFPKGSTYREHPKSEKGDLIAAIDSCISVLKDKDQTKEDRVFHLKMLVHLIGDLHQPLHIGLADDRGGNDFQVRWFNKGTNLHAVWDTEMLESYNMSYSELALNSRKLSKRQLEEIRKGDHRDWARESRQLFEDIYTHTARGEKLGYSYMYRYVHTARFQLQKAGIRLAAVLNEIFS
jgi:hypothetical protein